MVLMLTFFRRARWPLLQVLGVYIMGSRTGTLYTDQSLRLDMRRNLARIDIVAPTPSLKCLVASW